MSRDNALYHIVLRTFCWLRGLDPFVVGISVGNTSLLIGLSPFRHRSTDLIAATARRIKRGRLGRH